MIAAIRYERYNWGFVFALMYVCVCDKGREKGRSRVEVGRSKQASKQEDAWEMKIEQAMQLTN